MADDAFGGAVVAIDQDVAVVGHDGEGADDVAGVAAGGGEAAGDGERLAAVEYDGGALQIGLGRPSVGGVVRLAGDGTARVGFGGPAVFEQFPGADPFGPRAARIVGKPEAVGGEDDVRGKNHAGDFTGAAESVQPNPSLAGSLARRVPAT